jgi:acetate kinase
MKLILSVNAGSSSLKVSLYRLSPSITLLLTSNISNISSPPAKFSWNGKKSQDLSDIHDHASAFAHFLDYLNHDANIDRSQIAHICHRVVHGGDYTQRVVINDESYHHIETLSDLAPL